MPDESKIDNQLPTFAEAESNNDLVYSDHLPLLLTAPLTNDKELNIVSLNILGTSPYGGTSKVDTDENIRARYERVVDGLVNAISQNNAGVLCLQEVSSVRVEGDDKKYFIVEQLKKKLGTNWEIVYQEAELLTAYDKTRFKCESNSYNREHRYISLKLQDRQIVNNVVHVHNIWGVYDILSYYMENVIKTALRDKEEGETSVFVGDTNSRLAALGASKKNLLTTVVPQSLAEGVYGTNGGEQVGDFPDGGFVVDVTNKITQLKHRILNFVNGLVVEQSPLPTNYRFTDYRMILCIDDSFNDTPYANGMTLSELQDFISYSSEEQVYVRLAANVNNEKALAIHFPQRTVAYNQLPDHLRGEGVKFAKMSSFRSGTDEKVLFVPLEKAHLLTESLFKRAIALNATAPRSQVLAILKKQIERQAGSLFLYASPEKEEALRVLYHDLIQLPIDSELKDFLEVIVKWEGDKAWDDAPDDSDSENENKPLEKKYTNAKIISDHRNVFFSQNREKLTSSQIAIDEMKALLAPPQLQP